MGKHTNKVIKAFRKLNVNIKIRSNAAMVKRISNNQTEKRRTKVGYTRSSARQCLNWGNWKAV